MYFTKSTKYILHVNEQIKCLRTLNTRNQYFLKFKLQCFEQKISSVESIKIPTEPKRLHLSWKVKAMEEKRPSVESMHDMSLSLSCSRAKRCSQDSIQLVM